MSAIKDSLAAEFERGKPWNPRKNTDDPNPLYAEAVKWSTGPTAHGEADFLTVRDDDGTLWSILVGTYKLRKILLEGEISKWDETRGEYVVEHTIGPVEPGELVAIEHRGEREFTNQEGRRVTSPDYRVLRRPQPANDTPAEAPKEGGPDGDIPF
jgi:hypothetical protein